MGQVHIVHLPFVWVYGLLFFKRTEQSAALCMQRE